MAHGPTGPSDRQPHPRMEGLERKTAPGPSGGVCEWEASAPPITTASGGRTEAASEAGHCVHCARFPALIATLASLERKSVLLRVVGGLSIPDIEAVRGLTPTARYPDEHQTFSTQPPSATAPDPPPLTRVPVVLLPHTRIEPTDTRTTTYRAGRGNGMNHDQSPRQHPAQSGATTPVIATSAMRQWQDAELAMKVARDSFDRWLAATGQDAPSLALLHAYQTRTAVHKAAHAIATLVSTLNAEAAELITSPARDTHIPSPRH